MKSMFLIVLAVILMGAASVQEDATGAGASALSRQEIGGGSTAPRP